MADPAPQISGDTVETEAETEATTGAGASRRKCKATPMDTAKLMRKRATDRRSQQAFRERTKLRIAALENEVAKASQANDEVTKELHELTLERENLKTECLEWKKRARETTELKAQLQILAKRLDQVRVGGSGPGPEITSLQQAMPTRTSPTLDMTARASDQERRADHDPSVRSQPKGDQEIAVDGYLSTALITPEARSRPKEANGSSHEPGEFTPDSGGTALPRSTYRGRSESFLTDTVDFESVCFPMSNNQTSPRHGAAEILQLISKDPLSAELSGLYPGVGLCPDPAATGLTGDASVESPTQATRPYNSAGIHFQPLQAGSPPCWPSGWSPASSNQVDICEQLPYNLKPVAPGDHILQSLVSSRRSAAADGVPWDELLGPELPCWRNLVAPTPSSCGHTICQAVFDIVKAYTGYSGFPEKVSSAYIMYTSVLWRISLKRERFEKMPFWMRPRPIQSQVVHQAWIDRVPWPSVREILVKDQELYHVEEFGAFHSTSVSVNWPYSSDCVLIDASTGTTREGDGVLKLNPAFEEHIRDIRNWTAGPRFTQRYPELAAAVRQDTRDGYRRSG